MSQLDQLLLNFVSDASQDLVHLPYTAEFERLCQQAKPKASVEDKHRIWERLVEIRSRTQLPTLPPPPSGATPPASPDPTQKAAPYTPLATPPASLPTAPPDHFPRSLFEQSPVPEQQPWDVKKLGTLAPDKQVERDRLLADVANGQLGRMEQKTAYILQHYPDTRDSDIALCLRYWRRFQADVIERWSPLELEVLYDLDRMETIGRIRRTIQNDLHLFRGMEDVADFRNAQQQAFHEYVAAHKGIEPEIRFYLDETGSSGIQGKDGQASRPVSYVGVAGICVANWRHFAKHHAAFSQWRRGQGSENIHFAEMGSAKVDRAIALIDQLSSRRSGLLFVGYVIHSRARTDMDMFNLFIQLVVDSLHHLQRSGCLDEPTTLRVIKEAAEGFDALFLDKLQKQLSALIAMEFPGKVVVKPIETEIKGREVMLECADVIAGGMQRRALHSGDHPKDRLAECVRTVTGLQGPPDGGALYKYFPT